MKNVIVKLVEAHQNQLRDFDVKKELRSIQSYISQLKVELNEKSIYILVLKAIYNNYSKRATTVMVFINNMEKSIKELHGIVEIEVVNSDVEFARATLNFDEKFMGKVENKEAILIHLDIPVKGLTEDKVFEQNDLEVKFTDVRVTYVE